MSDLHIQTQNPEWRTGGPCRAAHDKPSHRYRVSFEFYASDAQTALEVVKESLYDANHVTLKVENLDRSRTIKQCLQWGAVIGLLIAAFALWCIAEGVWR